MSKRKIIFPDIEPPCTVIGLASNERIWKLCWELNQHLGLELSSEADGVARLQGPEVYQDLNTDPDAEYQLFEKPKDAKTSKVVAQFRFIMVVRHRPGRPKVDAPALLAKLSPMPAISLARDLSTEKDIERILP